LIKELFIIANELNNMSNNTAPFFSIIIPTFNRKGLLIRAINSLLLQEEQNWEAIIVDDGSDDCTYSFIQSYLKSDLRIQYIRQENSGAALAKNYGIEKAKGSFVTFLDSDDEYDLGHLTSRKKILLDNSDVQFLFGGLKVIGSPFVPDRFDTEKKIHLDDCVIGGTFFIERNLLVSLKGFKNILIGEDAELFERIDKLDILKFKTEIPSYIYRKDVQDSITNSFIVNPE
jgi:glycosyltransferase involved in cell wall biosynthesis